MRDPLDPIEKVRLNDTLKVRAPPGFRERVVAVAATEGIGLAEFARRAIVERVRRMEEAGLPTSSPAAPGASPPSFNLAAAPAAVSPISGASVPTKASTRRRDA